MNTNKNTESKVGEVLSARQGEPKNVVAFGATSFCNDTASEMAYWILPAFLTSIGAGPAALGIIEGIAESVTSLAKLASGYLSDKVPRKKPIVVAGYAVANAVKPLLAIAGAWWHVLLIRFADRLSKGIRGAPRDVMVTESAAPGRTGSAFGLLQSMDSAGAIAGPLLALAILPAFGFRGVFVAAAIPGALAVVAVTVFVRERRSAVSDDNASKIVAAKQEVESEIYANVSADARFDAVPATTLTGSTRRSKFPAQFYYVLFAVALFSIGNSSDMFLVLRAQSIGIPAAHAPLLGLVFNVTYTLFSWPAGKLSDALAAVNARSDTNEGRPDRRRRMPRHAIAAAGYLVFAATYVVFGLAPSRWAIWVMMALYGLYYALTAPVLKAIVAEAVPREIRGRAFGVFAFVTSVTTLLASVITGALWKQFGPAVPFLVSAGLAGISAMMLLAVRRSEHD
ncbi:MAG TPA: MFS transporter [Terriglobales bacterium]|nr:MFS transporter [Terriglobales bacterium]